jgi:DNA polymerase III epsilon subunit-like protein
MLRKEERTGKMRIPMMKRDDYKYIIAKGRVWNDTYVILRRPVGDTITLPASYFGIRPKTTGVLGRPGYNQLEWLYSYLGIPEDLVREIRRVARDNEDIWHKEERRRHD